MAKVLFWDKDEIKPANAPWNATFLDQEESVLLWDICTFNGQQLPGAVSVQAAPARKLDRQKVGKSNLERIVVRGYEPSEVMITVRIWTSDQWAKYQDIMASIWTPPSKDDPGPINVSTPALTAVNITKIKLVSISTPQDSEQGIKTITIRAVEFIDVPATKKAIKKTRAKAPNVTSAAAFKKTKELGSGGKPATKPSQTASASNNPG